MSAKEWTHVDKTTWGPGPWQLEPDKIQWIDPTTDLDCLMVRQERSGHWCGYVGVAAGHSAFEKGYEAVHERFGPWDDDTHLDVHGGLTFADACREGEPEGHGVCHIPEPGRPAHVWWLGFDCAHARDLSPGHAVFHREFDADHPEFAYLRDLDVYRDRAYVEAEVTSLARQLAGLSSAAARVRGGLS